MPADSVWWGPAFLPSPFPVLSPPPLPSHCSSPSVLPPVMLHHRAASSKYRSSFLSGASQLTDSLGTLVQGLLVGFERKPRTNWGACGEPQRLPQDIQADTECDDVLPERNPFPGSSSPQAGAAGGADPIGRDWNPGLTSRLLL